MKKLTPILALAAVGGTILFTAAVPESPATEVRTMVAAENLALLAAGYTYTGIFEGRSDYVARQVRTMLAMEALANAGIGGGTNASTIYVNFASVDSPNFTNSPTVSFTTAGSNITATADITFTREIKLRGLSSVYALTMLPNTNNPAAATFMKPVFADDAITNVNYVTWVTTVPADFDTGVAITARLYYRLMGADTGSHNYGIGFANIAESASAAATPGTWINLSHAGDAAGADGDLERIENVTLTGWAAGLTAGDAWMIRLSRDGPGTNAADSSTVDSEFVELVITYTSTQ